MFLHQRPIEVILNKGQHHSAYSEPFTQNNNTPLQYGPVFLSLVSLSAISSNSHPKCSEYFLIWSYVRPPKCVIRVICLQSVNSCRWESCPPHEPFLSGFGSFCHHGALSCLDVSRPGRDMLPWRACCSLPPRLCKSGGWTFWREELRGKREGEGERKCVWEREWKQWKLDWEGIERIDPKNRYCETAFDDVLLFCSELLHFPKYGFQDKQTT